MLFIDRRFSILLLALFDTLIVLESSQSLRPVVPLLGSVGVVAGVGLEHLSQQSLDEQHFWGQVSTQVSVVQLLQLAQQLLQLDVTEM